MHTYKSKYKKNVGRNVSRLKFLDDLVTWIHGIRIKTRQSRKSAVLARPAIVERYVDAFFKTF